MTRLIYALNLFMTPVISIPSRDLSVIRLILLNLKTVRFSSFLNETEGDICENRDRSGDSLRNFRRPETSIVAKLDGNSLAKCISAGCLARFPTKFQRPHRRIATFMDEIAVCTIVQFFNVKCLKSQKLQNLMEISSWNVFSENQENEIIINKNRVSFFNYNAFQLQLLTIFCVILQKR